jgi:hypothetical protein
MVELALAVSAGAAIAGIAAGVFGAASGTTVVDALTYANAPAPPRLPH